MKSGNGSETAKLERGEFSSFMSLIEYVLDGGLKFMCSWGSNLTLGTREGVGGAANPSAGLIPVNVGFISVIGGRTSVVAILEKLLNATGCGQSKKKSADILI